MWTGTRGLADRHPDPDLFGHGSVVPAVEVLDPPFVDERVHQHQAPTPRVERSRTSLLGAGVEAVGDLDAHLVFIEAHPDLQLCPGVEDRVGRQLARYQRQLLQALAIEPPRPAQRGDDELSS